MIRLLAKCVIVIHTKGLSMFFYGILSYCK